MSELPLSRRERPACSITADFLPDNMKKHRGPQGARALRDGRQGASVRSSRICSALFMLSFDPDGGVREQVQKTLVHFKTACRLRFSRRRGDPPVL